MSKYHVKIIWEREDDGDTLESFIDHTNLSPVASKEDITKLCKEAIDYNFKSVCVNPCYVKLCKELLNGTDVLICTVVGFPLGQNSPLAKIYETVCAVTDGADEIDMVLNIADLKARNSSKIIKEINDVVKASGYRTVKVIVETCLLTEEDKEFAIKVVSMTKAEFIKTSTGFGVAGASIDDVRNWDKWRTQRFSRIQIKAAGGIRTHHEAIDFIRAGANRIGTSKGVEIVLNTKDDPNFFDSNKNTILKDVFKNNKQIVKEIPIGKRDTKKLVNKSNAKTNPDNLVDVKKETTINLKEIVMEKKKKNKGIDQSNLLK